jgi:cell division protein YceG involved in septum cleavage
MTAAARRRWFGAALLVAAAVSGLLAWGWRDYTAPGPLALNRIVVIPRGAGIRAVARLLADNGVIDHPWFFVAGVFGDRKLGALKAGEYEFPAATSPRGAADLIASGRVVEHRFTVPEGLTSAGAVTATSGCLISRTRPVKWVVTCGSSCLWSKRRPISRQSATTASPTACQLVSSVTVRGSFR